MSFNFPEPLPVRYLPGLSYPLNLTADNRGYYTTIFFKKYQPAYGSSEVSAIGNVFKDYVSPAIGPISAFLTLGAVTPGGVVDDFLKESTFTFGNKLENMGSLSSAPIHLPIPKKVNEMNMMNWSEISLSGVVLDAVSSVAFGAGVSAARSTISGALQVGSAFSGIQINPFILQYFQRPSFREFSFSWTLAPRNERESVQIHKIINTIKAAQAPTKVDVNGALMGYPDLAVVQFYPSDQFQISLKECIIVGVNVDYTPAGPSYVNGTSAPSMINLTLHLKETKLWWSDEWSKEADKSSKFGPFFSEPGVTIETTVIE
jgi:hypothetical protein